MCCVSIILCSLCSISKVNLEDIIKHIDYVFLCVCCTLFCSCRDAAPPWAAAPCLPSADWDSMKSRASCSPSSTSSRPCQRVSDGDLYPLPAVRTSFKHKISHNCLLCDFGIGSTWKLVLSCLAVDMNNEVKEWLIVSRSYSNIHDSSRITRKYLFKVDVYMEADDPFSSCCHVWKPVPVFIRKNCICQDQFFKCLFLKYSFRPREAPIPSGLNRTKSIIVFFRWVLMHSKHKTCHYIT